VACGGIYKTSQDPGPFLGGMEAVEVSLMRSRPCKGP
jgi:hypothetical protein